MFESRQTRLEKASLGLLHKILEKSELISLVNTKGNGEKYQLDNCSICFDVIKDKIVMTPVDGSEPITIDCHYADDELQKFKHHNFSKLLSFARGKLQKHIEKTAKNNLKSVQQAIKKSKTIKQLDPNKYTDRYELDYFTIDFNSNGGMVVTIIPKLKNALPTEIRWADVENLPWQKFYHLLDLTKDKYTKQQKRLAEQKATDQFKTMRNVFGMVKEK